MKKSIKHCTLQPASNSGQNHKSTGMENYWAAVSIILEILETPLNQALSDCLDSEKYRYAKAMVLGQKPARDDIPCTQCKRYQRVKKMPFTKTLLQL